MFRLSRFGYEKASVFYASSVRYDFSLYRLQRITVPFLFEAAFDKLPNLAFLSHENKMKQL